jgi:hypothetical protein
MKAVFFLVAMTIGFLSHSQTFSNPIVLKSFNKKQEKNMWYTSSKPGEDNVVTMIGYNEDMSDYYKDVVEYLNFDPNNPMKVEGVVMIWYNDDLTIRVSKNMYTIISVITR